MFCLCCQGRFRGLSSTLFTAPLTFYHPLSALFHRRTASSTGKVRASKATRLGWSSITRLASTFLDRSLVSYPHSWTCMDLYIFATPYRVTWDYYFLSREHTLEISEWEDKAEYEYVKNKGVSIFLMQAGMIGTFQALWDVFPLFTNTGWGENSNIGFLEKHMGASFEERPQPWVTNISVDDDSEGKLWIGESGHENEKGEDIIAIIPWDEWWDFELNKDDSNPHIAYLPLHSDVRAKFNETAAWEYALSMAGKPYGYHNMIFSWIDTIDGNYPPPLDAHVFIVSKCLPGNHARSFCHDSLE
ncbi:hypothetical protein V6N13_141655 [Hibiscus sabdariffa]